MDDYRPPQEYVDPRDYSAEQLREFLKKISMLESSSGQNLNHEPIKSGIHAGTSAVGEYGLMPLTAKDLDKQYGVNELQHLNPEEISNKLESDKSLYDRISSTLASQLLQDNPSEVAAYKWEHGQYSKPSKDKLEKSERVRRFRVLKNEK